MFDVEDFGQAVYAHVMRAELARRLPAGHVRLFAPYGAARPTRADRGDPAEELGEWSPARAAALADELDFVVVGGAGVVSAGEGRFFVDGLPGATRWHVTDADQEAAARDAGVEGTVDVTAHPAVLLSRVLPAPVVEKRLEYLRVMGWYPREGGALVIQGAADLVPDVPTIVAALRQVLDDHPGLAPVLVELDAGDRAFADSVGEALGRPVLRLPSTVSIEDVAAAISAADCFMGSSQAAGLTALGYRRPWVGLSPESGAERLTAAFATAMKKGADDEDRTALQAGLVAFLDGVADDAMRAARDRHPDGLPDATRAALESELAALRRAHRSRTERAAAERVLLADHVARAEAAAAAVQAEVEDLRVRVAQETEGRARAEAECAALRQTRTFRWTASARALYRRLGGGR